MENTNLLGTGMVIGTKTGLMIGLDVGTDTSMEADLETEMEMGMGAGSGTDMLMTMSGVYDALRKRFNLKEDE